MKYDNKKNGFIATSLVYSFVLAIFLLMSLAINNYIQSENITMKFSQETKKNLNKETILDKDNSAESLVNYIRYLVRDYPAYLEEQIWDNSKIIKLKDPPDKTCENTLSYDGTKDNNLRYVGLNPCNFLKFNNELWRIIGVFNNVDDGLGNKETRIKIVKFKSVGSIIYDASRRGCIHDECNKKVTYDGKIVDDYYHGETEYSSSDIMKYLNSIYLTDEVSADFNAKLSIESQKLIGNVLWYNGKVLGTGTFFTMYNNERITKRIYIGKIGLLYPSDLGFSNTNFSSIDGEGCYWEYGPCSNTFLYNYGDDTYTLVESRKEANEILTINSNYESGGPRITESSPTYKKNIYPVVYLKPDVAYKSGYGTRFDPYELK